ncbi:MAG: hypothetical protein U0M60_10675, partial [Clostridia bacterium]|nr:hypothetical protein [Clostridia bacterium]
PKINAIMDYAGQTYRVPVEEPNPVTLRRYIDEIMQNRDEISAKLIAVAEESERKAAENAIMATGLIEN